MIGARIGIALATLGVIAAAPVGPRYGETIVAAVMARDRSIEGVRITAAAKDGTAIVVAAGAAPAGQGIVLHDAMGNTIGTVAVAGRRGVDAAAVATYLSRRIYVAGNLAEPDPYVPGARRSRAAQSIVATMLARYPDLVTLALHVGPAHDGRIVGSNFGRIGKPNDADDDHVVRDGAVLMEASDGGARLAVELPLLDRRGRTIGALSTSFRVVPGADSARTTLRATELRDAIGRAIRSAATVRAAPEPSLQP